MAEIAILGFGNIGSGVADLLLRNQRVISAAAGETLSVKYVLDKRDLGNTGYRVANDISDIINDPDVSVVCEMMGGTEPAYAYSLAALKAGKDVVTSNKGVVAKYGVELIAAAKENGVHYLYEASVGGGIPIMHAFDDSLKGLSVNRIDGILNGTTNYILTRMHDCFSDFSDALKEAQKLGYAEADPTADVSGADACRKICILAAIAWGNLVNSEEVYCEGITEITTADNDFATRCGGVLKLVGSAERKEDAIYLVVTPAVVLQGNPLSSASGVFNAVKVNSDGMGDLMFYGMGAGKYPTACAVISDIIATVTRKGRASCQKSFAANTCNLMLYGEAEENYCVAVKADKATVATCLRNYCVLGEDSGILYLLCEKVKKTDLQKAFEGLEIIKLMRAIV